MNDRQRDWHHRRATTFLNSDPESPLAEDERAAVDRIVDNARVVGIGEAVHGSKTIIQSVGRVLRFLTEERQADILVLEACFGATQALNRYLVHGEGEAEEALVAIGGWNYANQETLGLMRRLRNHNGTPARAGRPVRAFGCDCQSLNGPKTLLLRLLQGFAMSGALSETHAAETATLVTALPTDGDLNQFVKLIVHEIELKDGEPSRMAEVEAWQSEFAATVPGILEKASGRLQEVRRALPSTVSDDDRFLFDRCRRSLEQVVDFYSAGDGIKKRDAFMAENILAIGRHFTPHRMLVLSHNLHVARTPILVRGYQFVTMGHHLAQELGDNYGVVGTAFYAGQHLAFAEYRPEDDVVANSHTPGPLAVETLLQQIAVNRQSRGLLINLRKSDQRECECPWADGIEMRLGEAGRPGDYAACFVTQHPDLQFDGLLFIEESSPITILPGLYHYSKEQWEPSSALQRLRRSRL